MRNLKYFSTFSFLLFATSIAFAQNMAVLAGYIKDGKTGEPLIGATVQLIGTNIGATSDVNGFFEFVEIPAKTYNIEVSYVGYKKIIKYNIVLRSGGNPPLNLYLEESINILQDVVAVANPFEKSEETPMSLQKLSLEEIVSYPGGNNDIAKVVQSLPGVSGSVAGFRNDVIIRGGAPNENVYYLDGIEIPNINHFSTQGSAGGPVGMLNVSFFESVELATGSFAARYDNVLSGVLQFNQRDGDNRKFQTNLRVGASETALTTEGPLFKKKGNDLSKTSFIASIRRSYLQLLFKALDLPFLPDYWDYQYKISHEIDQFNSLVWTGIGSIDNFSINVPKKYNAQQQSILEQIPTIGQWTTTSGLIWNRRFKDYSGIMSTIISGNVLNNRFQRFRDNVDQNDLYYSNLSEERELRLKWQATKFIDNWTLNGGGAIINANYTNETTDLTKDFSYNNAINFMRYGMFGQASVVLNRWSLSGGFRMDGNSFTTEGDQFWRTFSPRLSISLQLDPAGIWFINGAVGRYYKIPPYTILGFTDNNGINANKGAKYIRNDQATLGIEYLLSQSARITVEGFYKKYNHYPVSQMEGISLANRGADFEVLGNEPVVSVGLGRTKGIEFLFQQKFSKNFYGILAYTLYKSEFTGLDPAQFFPSAWDNRHLFSFTGGYKFPRNWETGLRYRYVGKAPYAPIDKVATLANYPAIIKNNDRFGSDRLDAFNQLDIRIDKKWNFRKLTLEVYIEAQNILVADLPSEPRYGLIRDESGTVIEPRELIEIDDVSNSQILPTIGVVVNF